MRVHSPYRTADVAVARFLRRFALDSLQDMKAQVARCIHDSYGVRVASFEYFKPWLCLRVLTDEGPLYFKAFDQETNTDPAALMDLLHLLTGDQKLPLEEAFAYLQQADMNCLSARVIPRTHVHGDYKPSHVYQKNGEITGIIDLDFAGYAERIRDLGSATAGGLDHDGNEEPSYRSQRVFMQEYQTHIQLAEKEAEALRFLLLWYSLHRAVALIWWRVRGVTVDSHRIACAINDLVDRLGELR